MGETAGKRVWKLNWWAMGWLVVSLGLLLQIMIVGCEGEPKENPHTKRVIYTETREPCDEFHPYRKAYFGDLHVHGAYSFDAWAYKSRLTPDDIYRFAQGKSVQISPFDANGKGREVKLKRALDFAAVTEHAEFLGEVAFCSTPGSGKYNEDVCKKYRVGDDNSVTNFGILLALKPQRLVSLCGADGNGCMALAKQRWDDIIKGADKAYDRTSGCRFVSFVGYEYTTTPGVSNVHRNVIFRNNKVPELPVSFFEQPTPYGLWRALKESCIDGIKGCDVMSIGHNSNLSNGKMFALRYSDRTQDIEQQKKDAVLRARMEPLLEMMQHKGSMECRNGLTNQNGQNDPYCDFEKLRDFEKKSGDKIEDCGTKTGDFGMRLAGCVSWLDFTRGILKVGLMEKQRLGVNPYRLGVIGATDTHNGIAGYADEKTFPGHVGTVDDTPIKRLGDGNLTHDALINNPGGIAVVWAKERSRDAIFNAFQSREVYATSGPRITVRFFGGWQYPEAICDDKELAKIGYEQGVPMGSKLPKRPADAGAPMFIIKAEQDQGVPDQPGTPLQQVQIIKAWSGKDGKIHEKVLTVAGDPKNGASVDTSTCKRTGAGSSSLCVLWKDPDFDPSQRAFYYVRVLENPSCRWSTYVCNALPADKRPPEACGPNAKVPKVIQERAWTSAIWYEPTDTP